MAHATLSEVNNISIPYLGDVPQPLCVGRQIYIHGFLQQNQTFAVNLQCGTQNFPQLDAALHFNPRPSEDCVVRNSHEGGRWKKEERWGGFPFKTGQNFELVFQVEREQYKILVNGRHFQNFQHRISLHRITHMSITGAVTVNTVRHTNPARNPYPVIPAARSNPSMNLPYLGDIPLPMCIGKKITIQGSIPQSDATFSINLQCGRQDLPNVDVALHFNPRFTENCVVRNSLEGGQWKKEEIWGGFPFQTGQQFELVLLVEHEHYKIIVNRKLFQTFQHRIPIHRVTNLGIKGNIAVTNVRYTDPIPHFSQDNSFEVEEPIIKLPYIDDIPPPICEGKKIIIRGHMPQNSGTFAINLQCGRQDPPNGDMALHFNPRFTENCVVRNSHEGGQWKKEERWGGFPFQTGQTFELVFLIEHQHYKITVNGNLFQTFQHRIPIHRVTTLGIKGNVTINSIRFQDPCSQSGSFASMEKQFGNISISQGQPAYSSKGMPAMPSPPYQHDLPPPYQVSSSGFQGPSHYTPGGAGYSQPIYNPAVPFLSGIPGGLQPGKMICVDGMPLSTCNRFSLNLQSNATETANIAFHFDVRISFNQDNNVIVRNSRFNGSWGVEERGAPYFPFLRGVPFQMLILFDANLIKVAVNNQHFLEFRYRLNYGDHMSNYSIMKIQGDVQLTQIRFQ